MGTILRRIALTAALSAMGGAAVPTTAQAAAWPGSDATTSDWPQGAGYSDHRARERAETILTPGTVSVDGHEKLPGDGHEAARRRS
ncbi:hypothetical protein GCM10009810_31330 [Nostocoides vanveenii]|uniref:Uncharacterized protein n=1 Tax=Nostocoides vanveenii TaxID=330835 RepID=A0ABP4X652_9MICO